MSKEIKITKKRVKEYYDKSTCKEERGFLHRFFPEAFKEEWDDISTKVIWRLRNDGVLQMNYPEADDCIGHLWIDGEFYWTKEDFKEEIEGRSVKILKRRSK